MEAQARQQYNQVIRVVRIAVVISCAAGIAALAGWAPSSIGGANDNAAPVRLSAAPAQSAGATEASTGQAHRATDAPTRPTCAELDVGKSTPEVERTGEAITAVGCGVRSNIAEATPASNQGDERVDVATLLAWHVQAHNLIQYAHQTTLSGPSQIVAKDDRPRPR